MSPPGAADPDQSPDPPAPSGPPAPSRPAGPPPLPDRPDPGIFPAEAGPPRPGPGFLSPTDSLPPLPPRISRYSLPAALVEHRGFTWSCAAVTAGLVGVNLAGIKLFTCPFLSLTGLPCPGCGLTRSCSCLLRGEFQQSIAFHPFGPVLFVIGLTGLAGSLLPDPARPRLVQFLARQDRRIRFTPLLLAGLVIYAFYRWIRP